MTPKEKAKELYYKYADALNIRDLQTTANPFAKQCAIIAVDEVLKVIDDYNNSELCHETLLQVANGRFYWTEVKTEIITL